MATLTISLQDDLAARLREIAAKVKLSPEKLAQRIVERLLEHAPSDFETGADYVLGKNAKLYRRLAGGTGLTDSCRRPTLGEAQKAELDRRITATDLNPDKVFSWDEVLRYIRRQK